MQYISCKEVEAALGKYLDRALSRAARQRVENHLRSCPACAQATDSLRYTLDVLARMPRLYMPPATKRALVELFNSSPATQDAKRVA